MHLNGLELQEILDVHAATLRVLSETGMMVDDAEARRLLLENLEPRLLLFATEAHEQPLSLDGLRAVAVVGVLLYHADVRWMPGGFLGVEVFAAGVGRPAAARAAGTALATNPFPIVVPCHRAVRADGSPGGYQGGPAMKRALLALEGVRFDAAGRVAVARFHYGRGDGACRPAARTRE